MDIKLTKAQKDTTIVIVAIAAAFFLFASFVYLPMRRELARMQKEYNSIDADIKEIQKLSGGKSLEETIAELTERIDVLKEKFPSKEEGMEKMLADSAAANGIELHSMTPDKKRDVTDIGGVPINIKGCVVREMVVTLNMKTNFRNFIKFIKYNREQLPVYIRTDYVSIEKVSKDKPPLLNIEMKSHAYLVCIGS